VPILSKYYRLGPPLADTEGIWGLIALCAMQSLGLHLLGQLFLGGLVKGHDILPYAAPIIFSAMVAITSWLSYRRIMKKYPPASAGKASNYANAEIKKPA
jgi:hypothetical protein